MKCLRCQEELRSGYNRSDVDDLCYRCECLFNHGIHVERPAESRLKHRKGGCSRCDHYRRMYGAS